MTKLVIKTKLVAFAALCFLAVGVWTTMLVQHSGWHHAEAKIISLAAQCAVRTGKDDSVYAKDIACEQVDAFKLTHADRTWTVKQTYNATIAFEGVDGPLLITQMKLYPSDGKSPAVGDTLPVLQNPQDRTEIITPPDWLTVTLMILAAGLIGCAIIYFVFGRKLIKRMSAAAVRDTPADQTDRNTRADAMIAAAHARREAEARSRAPAPLIVRAGTPQARGFGRKR